MLDPGVLVGGDFRVERKLSEGGMGAVFVAEQVSTGAKRALKIIRPELLRHPKLRQRFSQEAKVTASIASDHVVSVVAAGFDAGLEVPWLAMELLSGETLHDLVEKKGELSPEMAIVILRQLAHAMDAAHAAGVVHRDLKPDNIFLAESRRSMLPFFVKVLDFGIARIVHEAQSTHTESLGTPLWMSPEQAGSGEAVGPWTDVWAFGLIVFFLLTGRMYWLASRGEGTPLAAVREICFDPFAPARARARELDFEGELPEAFDAWFARTVARETAARFASCGEATIELARVFGLPESDRVPSFESLRHSSRPTKRTFPPPKDSSPIEATQLADHVSVAHAKTELDLARPTLEPPPRVSSAPSGTPSASERPKAGSPRDSTAPSRPPPAIVQTTQPSPGQTPRSPWPRRLRLAALGLFAVAFFGGGARTYLVRRDTRECQDSRAFAACKRACARGLGSACTTVAIAELGATEPQELEAAMAKLRASCKAGDPEACEALGYSLAFPPRPGMTRDWVEAGRALEKACAEGRGCALAGTLKGLGVETLAREIPTYFDAACPSPPTTRHALIDCAIAATHEVEGAPRGTAVTKTTPAMLSALRTECTDAGGDACGLLWLDTAMEPRALVQAYVRGCETGSSLACDNLGAMRAEGKGGAEPNPTQAREAFERACVAGEPSGCNNLGVVKGALVATPRRGPRGAIVYKLRCSGAIAVGCSGWGARTEVVPKGTPGSALEAAQAFERGCTGGLGAACVNLGALAYLGRGIPRDRARAERLFSETCFRGDASACGEQGTALLTLRMDHPRDVRAGITFLERACKGFEEDSCMALYGHLVNGLPDAKRELEGVNGLLDLAKRNLYSRTLVQLYETGARGLPKNLEEARRVAIATCDTDLRCSDAAYFHSRGVGGPRDEGRALEALGRGCDADDFPSCVELGSRHREGRGLGKDPTRAVELFRRACDGGDSDGCALLSRAYATADGAPRDAEKALGLARAACEGGAAEGCAAVGVMLADGEGAKKDLESAIPYLSFGCRRAVQSACQKLQSLGKDLPDLDL
jgi:serine/threonine protein kinase/TPR repeat protein